ncbi:MAG TPA: DUF3750 domain-containing protein [Methylomirabilota bacterium]
MLVTGCSVIARDAAWWEARRDSSGLAPDPARTVDAVLQVYAARTVGWRGLLAVHTWIALKRTDAHQYTRYEVIGWGVERGLPALRVNRTGADNWWFGSEPELLLDRRGPDVDALIDRVETAIAAYPYRASYRTWPGPNSNTFVAYVARAVPELRLALPATAIGKDFLAGGALGGSAPSGSGVQFSLLGLAGVVAGWDDGLEVNVLGLTFGIDLKRPAFKLPGVGRVGMRAADRATPAHATPAG